MKQISNQSTKQRKFKRLFFDIETSPNIVYSWNVGRKINLDYTNIVEERAIITICYKWEHEKTVHHLKWNKGNDKAMLQEFSKVMNEADECIGHNSDNFDTKWVRTRCLYHNISMLPEFTSIDTLKVSRGSFRFNSNRLNYIGQYLGVGKKKDTGGFDLWKDVLKGSTKALNHMIAYCKQDVLLLEKVFHKLNPYIKHKTHVGILEGKGANSCPKCGSTHIISNGFRISARGTVKRRYQCTDCGGYHSK